MDCDYCYPISAKGRTSRIKLFSSGELHAYINELNDLEIEFQDGREQVIRWIGINYCPKCGRNLK